MLLPDVSILVHAYHEAAPDHRRFGEWLEDLVNGEETYGMSDLVLSGFLRIVKASGSVQPAEHHS